MGRPLIPIIGKRFGKLLVVKRVKDRFNGRKRLHSEAWFLVKCDCGILVEMRGYMVRYKRVMACRTCKPKGFRHGFSKSRGYAIWLAAKGRAKEIGVTFRLKPKDICIPEICPLLGVKIVINNKKTSPNSPSLDRINSKHGYTKRNVWVISHRANTIKNDATLSELKMLSDNLEKKLGLPLY